MSTDPLLARTLGNYEIVSRLGRGGMATVYRAHQSNMQRDVAIKVMSVELASNPQFVSRFEQEAHVIAHLEHPRILPVHDYGHDGDYFYIVMRLVEGETLFDRLQRGRLSLNEAARFTRQIAEALDYAHSRGIVHRDLKPNNVLIDAWDNSYLMDFGLAKLIASSQQLTASGAVLGTPAYMSPEQWRGGEVDARTDVYALGVMLYEMVLGQPPFDSETPYSLMYKHLNDLPTPPREILPGLPSGVEACLMKALEKDPDKRYQTAGDLGRAFREAVHTSEAEGYETTSAHEGEPPEVSPRYSGAEAARRSALDPAGTAAGSGEPEHGPASQELEVVPAPANISPPQHMIEGVPPIPVPGRTGVNVPESSYGRGWDRRRSRGWDRRSRDRNESPLPFEIPEDVPPQVRSAIMWAAERAQQVSIPGFVEPSRELAPVDSVALPPDSNEWPMPQNALAFEQMADGLAPGEPLIGALYMRGTADWRNWRRMFFLGLVLTVLGSIFSGMFNLWLFHLLGTLAWIYLVIQGIRTWRGKTGHYLVGFTPQHMMFLPLTPGFTPVYHDVESAPWNAINRLSMTREYLWLESSGVDAVSFLGWIPAHGVSGLDRQRKWLFGSPIHRLLRERGYTIKS
ncbi:serine/threonine-protein kinase [Aggregatilinea lenta]|uniref:serine/threonine-protein kinase n=1 Tax=Aggregatilinea lenta TaxID=913108 RepID=UPI0013C33F01|nr:serine/threonine-protein kinase [Aggregatilinea lenta]